MSVGELVLGQGMAAKRITITGTVQGVGFRPFTYGLAVSLGLNGTVRNSGRGVVVEVEGTEGSIARFISEVKSNPPHLARITGCLVQDLPLQVYPGFKIIPTGEAVAEEFMVPPDAAICEECHREIKDHGDRHYMYPFTNCTACGPRFTIIHSLPYDRCRTSMTGFVMCSNCADEYSNPLDRRFHAQPVACPQCGPKVRLVDSQGRAVEGDWAENCRQLMVRGKIIALKSLGGFHLACDGSNASTIEELRRRKGRPAKPLAIMCPDLDTVRKFCIVSPAEEKLLLTPAAPIVVLTRKSGCALPTGLAPGLRTLGVMLPYTPLHLLLFKKEPKVLVMTSGNRTGLPLVKDNELAMRELEGIADYFLLHNRDIVHRCDDSVVQVTDGETQFLRRSRGYVPQPVELRFNDISVREGEYLGVGGDMKNTFCLLRKGRAYLSQHLGSVVSEEGAAAFSESLGKFNAIIKARPDIVAYDLHPLYRTGRLARSLPAFTAGVQHHHAHMASCMAENGLEGEVIGIILDGTGYGPDGNIWGFEVLSGGYKDFYRELHLEYIPLPGGDNAVRNPWITATALLLTVLGKSGLTAAARYFPDKIKEIYIIEKMIRRGINSPRASSCGRLLDAVAALLGVCTVNTYDGQAAIEVGELTPEVFEGLTECYPYHVQEDNILLGSLFRELTADIDNCIEPVVIARKFHDTLIDMAVGAAETVRSAKGLNRVVLSGGCWHNRYLLSGAGRVLSDRGFKIFKHKLVPPGDGGVSLGQAMIACHRYV